MTLQEDLKQFTGTEHWHPFWLGTMHYTDGVKHFANTAGAYWFLDIVGTEVAELQADNPFISVELTVKDMKANIKATDGNGNTLWTRYIEFTDCPDGVYSFYLIDKVFLLTSEY
ncbi:MAG: hypothetical protein CTY35_03495 [Methylotenera sp.]|nr:MAG: hypothetical protein CTY35_03495 [Methylotenera sp.]